jgi:polysaccharide export outer membrane protein
MALLSQNVTQSTLLTIAVLLTPAAPGLAQLAPETAEPEAAILPTAPSQYQPELTEFAPSEFPSGYRLGPGDQVAVTVLGYEEYTRTWTVLPDGTINLPVIGAVPVAGQTPEEFSQILTTRLNQYLIEPSVTISPTVLRPVIVNVAGAVERPGPVQLRSLSAAEVNLDTNSELRGDVDAPPTVSAALMEAGGITRNADIREVVLTRTMSNGDTYRTTINLWDAIWSENAPQDLMLQDGDSIFVPTLAEGEQLDRRLLVQSSLAPDVVAVRVVGEVNDPGEVLVPPDSSVSGAVAIAGGPTNDARLSRVALVRLNEDGQIEQQVIDLRDLADNNQIQNGDVIVVPERDTPAFLDFAGRLLSPLGGLLNVLGGFDNLVGN